MDIFHYASMNAIRSFGNSVVINNINMHHAILYRDSC